MVPHLFNLADLPTYLVLYQPWLGTGTEYALLWIYVSENHVATHAGAVVIAKRP